MSSSILLYLDTTGPGGVAGKINGDAAYANARTVTLAATSTDGDLTGYQMKVWGNVDPAANAQIQATEAASAWINYSAALGVTLASGDGTKTLNWRLRDDVWNESAAASDSITLDTTVPVITVTSGPDVPKISKVAGKDIATFQFSSDSALMAWKVKVVPNGSSLQDAGTLIGTASGSTGTSGGALAASTAQTVKIEGADLEAALAGDGGKTIKVFGQDLGGNWSVA